MQSCCTGRTFQQKIVIKEGSMEFKKFRDMYANIGYDLGGVK